MKEPEFANTWSGMPLIPFSLSSTQPVAVGKASEETHFQEFVVKVSPQTETESLEFLRDDDPMLLMFHEAVENCTAGRMIYVAGQFVSPMEAIHPEWFLPAIVIAAAQSLGSVVANHKEEGQPFLRLSAYNKSILGYRITGMEPSTPHLIMIPVVHELRSCIITRPNGNEWVDLDPLVGRFTKWLAVNGLCTSELS